MPLSLRWFQETVPPTGGAGVKFIDTANLDLNAPTG